MYNTALNRNKQKLVFLIINHFRTVWSKVKPEEIPDDLEAEKKKIAKEKEELQREKEKIADEVVNLEKKIADFKIKLNLGDKTDYKS